MRLLMIGHLIGDFYLQTKKMADEKRAAEKSTFLHALGVHSLLYVAAMYAVLVITTGSFTRAFIPVIIAGLTHAMVDYLKIRTEKRLLRFNKHEWITFSLDQLVHISILYGIDSIYNIPANFTWLPDSLEVYIMQYPKLLLIFIAVLVCGKPAAIWISILFKRIPHTIEEASKQVNDTANTYFLDDEDDNDETYPAYSALDKRMQEKLHVQELYARKEQQEEESRIGSWIGILEREIMLLLALMGQYGAIGFVLTAKSLARFKQLENKAFAEKYLLGTLLSSGIALLCIAMCMVI